MVYKNKTKFLKRQSMDSHRLKVVKKNKPSKDGLYTESLDFVYYCVFFELFDCERAKCRETLLEC